MTDVSLNADEQPVPLATVDLQLQEFLRLMALEASKHPRRDTVSVVRGREIAEAVRAQWTQGGPAMDRTVEHKVPTRHGDVELRVYYPSSRKLNAAMLYIHGGGFVLFSNNTHDRVMREYAERAGIVVMGINYTRAPEAKFPRPVDECVDTVHWMRAHADMLEFDVDHLYIAGDSAGANLSMGTAITFRDAGLSFLRGMVLNYGGYRFGQNIVSPSVLRYGAGEHGLSIHTSNWFRSLYIEPERVDPRLSPVAARLEHLPPAYMVITECDPLYDENIEMQQRLAAAEVAVEGKVYPGTVHSFLEAVSISDVAVQAFEDTVAWIQRQEAA